MFKKLRCSSFDMTSDPQCGKGGRNVEQCPFTITVIIIIPIFKFIQFLFLNHLLVQAFKRLFLFINPALLPITCF